MAATWPRRLRAFKRWMKSSGIEWNTDALEFTIQEEEEGEEEEMNISVRATGDLKEGQVIGRIPKSACLTVNTSSASQLIQEAGLGGSLGLAVAIMYEKGLAHRSPWAPYLALLPDSNAALPLLWSPPQIDRLLKGTELHKVIHPSLPLFSFFFFVCVCVCVCFVSMIVLLQLLLLIYTC
ncbi:hypothetical protein Tsubulata_030727 [Turnera subulata]|uniref:SET domain-containing protein n=1 Tax=Turnera subulata TaxID=218843 RepID=A0A9Q0JG94_9ROSI|nr:hypothetical protein Tsubulata_030727 [Turnera subulata]